LLAAPTLCRVARHGTEEQKMLSRTDNSDTHPCGGQGAPAEGITAARRGVALREAIWQKDAKR
jgi:hypothetical protein